MRKTRLQQLYIRLDKRMYKLWSQRRWSEYDVLYKRSLVIMEAEADAGGTVMQRLNRRLRLGRVIMRLIGRTNKLMDKRRWFDAMTIQARVDKLQTELDTLRRGGA